MDTENERFLAANRDLWDEWTGIHQTSARSRARRSCTCQCLDARFVCSNVYDLPSHLHGEFDVVDTSRGVLGWLPDVQGWARVVARFVKPGGIFYIQEVHPVTQVSEDEHAAPFEFDTQGSYADPAADVKTPKEYGWNHSMGEIVTALASAGLHVELLREFPYTEWAYPFLEERRVTPDGDTEAHSTWWLPKNADGELPLFFALRASKPLRS